MPKRYTYNRGDFFWAKQEDNGENWKVKDKTSVSLEINCELKDIKQEDRPVDIKIYQQHYRQEITGKTHPRRDTESENHRGFRNPRQLRQET